VIWFKRFAKMGSSFDKNDLLKNRGYKWWSGEVGRSHS